MNQSRSNLWRRAAARAAAAGILLLSVVGCAMTGSTMPAATQAATINAAGSNVQSEASDLEKRVRLFLLNHLAEFPATGRRLPHRGLWEFWIPSAKLVLWYRFTDSELQVVHVWHSSQDRQSR